MQIYIVYTYPCPKSFLLFPAPDSLLCEKHRSLQKRKFKLRKILEDKSCVKQEQLSGLSLRTADALLQMTTLYISSVFCFIFLHCLVSD